MTAVRVGLVIDRLDPGKGGAESYLTGLAAFLTRRGHDVSVLATRIGAGPLAAERCVVPLPPLPRALRDVAFDRAASRVAKDRALDVTLGVRHTPSTDVFQPHGGVYSQAALAQSRSAAAAGARHRLGRALNPKHLVLCHLERRQRAAKGVSYVALSERVRAHMIDAYRLPPAVPPRLVYNGVDLARFRPPRDAGERQAARARLGLSDGIPDDAPLVLFVAHNFRLKGLLHLLRAFHGLADRRARLVVVGRGKVAPYARLAAGLGLTEAVRFAGALDRMDEAYRAADLLAHPTSYDPCSCVCLEALASGLPVITTRANGVGELIAADGGVVLEHATDETGLTAALRTWTTDRAARAAAGHDARALAERHPEASAFEAMEAVLLDAAERRRHA